MGIVMRNFGGDNKIASAAYKAAIGGNLCE
jgi:hypothetical protein